MQKSNFFSSGILIAVIGVVLFSAKAVMVKMAYRYQVTSEHFLLFRMLFSLPFYLVLAMMYQPEKKPILRNTDYLWIIFFGFIGYYLASYFDFLGLQYIKAGLERIILFIYPTIVLLLSWLFLKKRITRAQIAAILITYFGVLIAFWGEFGWDAPNVLLGAMFIFLSALTYATYLVGSGWLIPKFGVMTFTSYAMIVSSICVIAQYLLTDRGDIFHYPAEVYILGVCTAVFSTIIPSYLVSAAISRLGASNFSIVASLGPISTILLAFFFLGERLTILQIIGAFIVILGIYSVTRKKTDTKKYKSTQKR